MQNAFLILTESSKSPAEQLFGVELHSEADCEYPLRLFSEKCIFVYETLLYSLICINTICFFRLLKISPYGRLNCLFHKPVQQFCRNIIISQK